MHHIDHTKESSCPPRTSASPPSSSDTASPSTRFEVNEWTREWAALGESLPERPRAVLAVSAHWYINATAVTAMSNPRTIHDFYGFPRELNEFEYPASGAPELAAEVAGEVVKPTWVGVDRDSWGLDHGTWSVLTHVFPDADVPVAQLSVDASNRRATTSTSAPSSPRLRDSGVLGAAAGNRCTGTCCVWTLQGNSGNRLGPPRLRRPHSVSCLPSARGRALPGRAPRTGLLAVPSADHFSLLC